MTDKNKPSDGAMFIMLCVIVITVGFIAKADTWLDLAKPVCGALSVYLLCNS